MILLTTVTDLVRLGVSPGVPLGIHASYLDSAGTVVTPGRKNTVTTTETSVDVVLSPGAGVERSVKTLHVRNKHATDPAVVTVLHVVTGAIVELIEVTLEAGEKLSYVEGQGFSLFDSDGTLK